MLDSVELKKDIYYRPDRKVVKRVTDPGKESKECK